MVKRFGKNEIVYTVLGDHRFCHSGLDPESTLYMDSRPFDWLRAVSRFDKLTTLSRFDKLTTLSRFDKLTTLSWPKGLPNGLRGNDISEPKCRNG